MCIRDRGRVPEITVSKSTRFLELENVSFVSYIALHVRPLGQRWLSGLMGSATHSASDQRDTVQMEANAEVTVKCTRVSIGFRKMYWWPKASVLVGAQEKLRRRWSVIKVEGDIYAQSNPRSILKQTCLNNYVRPVPGFCCWYTKVLANWTYMRQSSWNTHVM